jgi:hypothetical protein
MKVASGRGVVGGGDEKKMYVSMNSDFILLMKSSSLLRSQTELESQLE